MEIRTEVKQMKACAPFVASMSAESRNHALERIACRLKEYEQEIFEENRKDLLAAEEAGIAASVIKRLKFDAGKLEDVFKGLRQLQTLPDPVGKITLRRELDEDLILERVTCPIGVIGVIFEARPDALVQISSLCIKSGNCAILKGGKETTHTNRALFARIHEAALKAGMPEHALVLVEAHSEIDELLQCDENVDLIIPRGSNRFVQYIMDHTKIPVMGHADGVCHIYTDGTLDAQEALRIITDAKTQYPVACNAVETLLVNESCAKEFLPLLKEKMDSVGVRLRAAGEAVSMLQASVQDPGDAGRNSAGAEAGRPDTGSEVEIISDDDFHREYGDLILAVRLVKDVGEAVDHINRYGSHHTDSILTTCREDADYFLQMVDSAGVYVNCSTRFADGFRYGFGAEVGISTSKLHARGPVGLEGLVTYKYLIRGEGQIVGDYASGARAFHFRDL